jgi:adenosylmethionine-8-amino-7-oxononanoate aminotransferase
VDGARQPAGQGGIVTRIRAGFGLGSLPRIVRGEGSYLFDENGRRYLDASGGPAAFSIGHGNREVNAAVAAQLDQIACAYRYLFTSSALEQLTHTILEACGPGFGHVVYSSSGSEAVESALKLALQFFCAQGLGTKQHFIARERSYHGDTLGALSVSGFAERRRPFEGSLLDVSFVSAANAYRRPAGVSAESLADHLAAELDSRILSVGAERIAGFIFEPVVGAAGGVVPAPPGYAAAVRAVCDRHNVLLIADEVMCGAGRCGTWRALEHDGVEPDIMAVAKGLAGGYIPLAATIMRGTVGEVILREHGAFMTGHTYSGHTAACAAGFAVQRIVLRDGLLARVRVQGERLRQGLADALSRFDEVGDVRGRGYFIGVELVSHAPSKQPFPAERGMSHRVGREAFEGGLICYPCAGNVGNGLGDTLIIAPPFTVSDAELEEIIEKFPIAVERALQD